MSLESGAEEPLLQACLFFVRMSLVGEKKHLGTFSGRGNKGNGVGRTARKMCARLLLARFKSIFKVMKQANTGVCSMFTVKKWKNDSQDSSCKLCNMIKAGQ